MDSLTSNMIKQSDIAGRLRLFRYGLVVITVVTFLLGIVYPWAAFRSVDDLQPPSLMEYLPFALMITVIVGIVMVVVYFVYAEVLKRTIGEKKS